MADEVLTQLREQIDIVNKNIQRSKDLISMMSEAGEDTSTLAQDLRSLEIRKTKWENMLKNRGA